MKQPLLFIADNCKIAFCILEVSFWYETFNNLLNGMKIPDHVIARALNIAYDEAIKKSGKVDSLLIEFLYNHVRYSFFIGDTRGIYFGRPL